MTETTLTMPFEGQDVRITDQNGQPWLFAKDVCACLGLGNPSQALSRLDDDEKGIITSDTLRGETPTLIISESGFYALVLTSRKAEAKAFKRWVTRELLPTFRARMGYADPRDFVGDAPGRSGSAEDRTDEVIRLQRDLIAAKDQIITLMAEGVAPAPKGGPRMKKTPEQVAEIRRLYMAGWSQADIARELDCADSTVSKYIADLKPGAKTIQ